MRLLNVRTIEFQRFAINEIPRYAIASHRWGPDEAAYKDVFKRRNLETQGYKKVEAFCAFVQKWDSAIEWLWIDTCCIDKKSSAEETESINSMYQYYHRADVCIAFLADVPGMETFGGNDRALIKSFENSVWFTRGWTLQELLAPTTVVFTTSLWEVIGYKTQAGPDGDSIDYGAKYGRYLNDTIARITDIPEGVLWDFPQSRTLSVQQRMSWMNKRTTTRVEDMAYCLLGIFGVHMALIYGEGEGAMARLEEEVRKRENMSIAGSIFGDDSRTIAAPSVYGGGRREESPPPMPPPRRAMTFQTESGLPDWRAAKREYKEGKKQMREDGNSVLDSRTVIGEGNVRGGIAPRLPERPPPSAPGLNERVHAWRDQTEEPTPSVIGDPPHYADEDDTETLLSWRTAPAENSSNFTGAYNHGHFSPPPAVNHGAFSQSNLQDLSDALPPPYPGPPPRANTTSPYDAPPMGINRAQTSYAPSAIGSSVSQKPDLKTKRLLRRLADERAKRANLEGPRDDQTFAPPSRSATFAGADDLESVAPSDSASSIGGSQSRSGSSHVGPSGRSGLMKLLSDEREKYTNNSSSSRGDAAPAQGIGRSQTFASGGGGLLSTIGNEVGASRKALKQMLADEKSALRQARKAKRRGEK